jgi:hypothetical protein
LAARLIYLFMNSWKVKWPKLPKVRSRDLFALSVVLAGFAWFLWWVNLEEPGDRPSMPSESVVREKPVEGDKRKEEVKNLDWSKVSSNDLKILDGPLRYDEGELVRYAREKRAGAWGSYVIVRSMKKNSTSTFHVHPVLTMVRRGKRSVSLDDLVGGMKVGVFYRRGDEEKFFATMVRIG